MGGWGRSERNEGAGLRKRSCTSLGKDSKAHTGGIIRRKLSSSQHSL